MFDPDRTPSRLNQYTGGTGIALTDRDGPQPGKGSFIAQLAAPQMSPQERARLLDNEAAGRLHDAMMGHYTHELDRQAENRLEMAMDEDFFDHIQYTDEELATLNARGQAPVVFNMIQTSVNWVLGTQRRAAMDYRILPRKKQGLKAAERKTQLMKHVSDENLSEYEWSDAFRDAVRAGIGWMESGQGYPDEAKVYDRHENWRSMLWDSTARRYDLQDSRYLFRTKWLDADICEALWGQTRGGILRQSLTSSSTGIWMDDDLGDDPMDFQELEHFRTLGSVGRMNSGAVRERIRVIEGWFRRPVPNVPVLKGGQFNGELFDEWSPGHWNELNQGFASLSLRPREVIFCAIFTDVGLLDLRRSPYRHNRYPFTPLWGYRRARDGMPYGMIRGLRDIQRDLNKRQSKALHHLSTTRVVVEENAVDDIDVLRDEAARPDAVIVHKMGKAPPSITTDTNLAAAHIELASRDAQMIQSIGGVTDENLGRKSNATSGKAIVARQDQGALATSQFFDNLRRSRMIHGEKQLVNIEQFYTDQDEIRITDARGKPDWVPINDGNDDNAIASTKADFIVSEEDWRATARQAQAEQLLELASKLAATSPEMVVGMLDLVIEALDVPKRDELVKRIRQITGQPDPDADPNNPDPEAVARQKAAAEEAELNRRGVMAKVMGEEAKARKTIADALKAEVGLPGDAVAVMRAAFDAALQVAGAPAVARAADTILSQAMAAAGAVGGGQAAPMAQLPQAPMGPNAMPAMPVPEGV